MKDGTLATRQQRMGIQTTDLECSLPFQGGGSEVCWFILTPPLKFTSYKKIKENEITQTLQENYSWQNPNLGN